MSIFDLYQILGQLVFIVGLALLALLSTALILGRMQIKEDRLIFPKLLLFTVDVFYGLFKKFSEQVGVDGKIVDQIGVEVRNKVNQKDFRKTKHEDKILVLPHCLRNTECQATLETSGIICKNCNKCVIGVLKNKGEDMGYKVYIIPGSQFLKKIVEQNKFKAILGVACYQDLNLCMMNLSNYPVQGVPLLRDGCINTKVDSRAVLEKMGAILLEDSGTKLDGSCSEYNPKKAH